MGNQPYWQDNTDVSWDLLVIADLEFVGFATLIGGMDRDIQIKKPKGADGATMTDNGYNPAKFSITLKLVEQVDWDAYQNDLLPQIHPRRKGGSRTPVIVTHPAINVNGVSRVYFTQIGMPEIGSDKIATVKLQCVEWFPAPRVVKKAAGKGATAPDAGNAGSDVTKAFGNAVFGPLSTPSEFGLTGIGFDSPGAI